MKYALFSTLDWLIKSGALSYKTEQHYIEFLINQTKVENGVDSKILILSSDYSTW